MVFKDFPGLGGSKMAHVGPIWGYVGAMLAYVGAMLRHFEAMLSHLEAMLGYAELFFRTCSLYIVFYESKSPQHEPGLT